MIDRCGRGRLWAWIHLGLFDSGDGDEEPPASESERDEQEE